MIKDKNLAFLKVADNDDLKTLVDYMIPHESKGVMDFVMNTITRISGELYKKDSFKRYYPNRINMLTDDVIDELQRFAGSTFANIIRGHGVGYSEILCDVAKKVGSPYDEQKSIEENEYELLCTMLVSYVKDSKLSAAEVKQRIEELGVKAVGSREAMVAALQLAIKNGGFTSYQIAVIVANMISKTILNRGLSFATNAALTKYMGMFAGPLGWTFTGLWTLFDIGKTAYRITIPAVIHIAYMRQKFNNEAYGYSR